MAVFLGLCLVLLNFLAFSENADGMEGRILGGPDAGVVGGEFMPPTQEDMLGAVFAMASVDKSGIALENSGKTGDFWFLEASLRDQGGPAGGGNSLERGIFTYIIEGGDTLSSIAADFGVSIEALIQANPAVKSRSLRVGQELTILPVAGAIHTTAQGESISSLAAMYGVSAKKIKEYNTISEEQVLNAGVRVIIPGARAAKSGGGQSTASLASAGANAEDSLYFLRPAQGFNWGIQHGNNGVDIANNCGTPVVAVADGLVMPGGTCEIDEGWNGGYGMCITIQHANNIKTRYAHLEKSSVEIGDYVKQGEVIGLMGSTGKSTGCHLHFEVIGATNPLVKY